MKLLNAKTNSMATQPNSCKFNYSISWLKKTYLSFTSGSKDVLANNFINFDEILSSLNDFFHEYNSLTLSSGIYYH